MCFDIINDFSVRRYVFYSSGQRMPRADCANAFRHVRPAKTQIGLRICAVQSESSLSAWSNFGIIGYPKCAQWRFWSDCANVQADMNLRCAHLSDALAYRVQVQVGTTISGSAKPDRWFCICSQKCYKHPGSIAQSATPLNADLGTPIRMTARLHNYRRNWYWNISTVILPLHCITAD